MVWSAAEDPVGQNKAKDGSSPIADWLISSFVLLELCDLLLRSSPAAAHCMWCSQDIPPAGGALQGLMRYLEVRQRYKCRILRNTPKNRVDDLRLLNNAPPITRQVHRETGHTPSDPCVTVGLLNSQALIDLHVSAGCAAQCMRSFLELSWPFAPRT